MSFLNLFKSKKNPKKIDNMVIGYLRRETSKQLGVEPNSKEYNDFCISSKGLIEFTLVPLLDKQLMQEVSDTLSSVTTNRLNEMVGEFMLQLYSRFSLMSIDLMDGKLTPEEALLAEPNNLAKVLHEEIKSVIKQLGKHSDV